MKTIIKYMGIPLCLLVLSCQREKMDPLQVSAKEYSFSGSFIDHSETKTSVQNGGTTVFWQPGDAISVFNAELGMGRFVSSALEPSEITVFTGSFQGGKHIRANNTPFWAVYPYDEKISFDEEGVTMTIPTMQEGLDGSFGPGMFPSLAKTEDDNLFFYNICGGISFSVTRSDIKSVTLYGNGEEIIAGQVRASFADGKPVVKDVINGQKSITLMAPKKGCFTPGVLYFISVLPVEFKSGYTLIFHAKGSRGSYVRTTPTTINRSRFKMLLETDLESTFEKWSYLTIEHTEAVWYGPVFTFSGDNSNCVYWGDGVIIPYEDNPVHTYEDNQKTHSAIFDSNNVESVTISSMKGVLHIDLSEF